MRQNAADYLLHARELLVELSDVHPAHAATIARAALPVTTALAQVQLNATKPATTLLVILEALNLLRDLPPLDARGESIKDEVRATTVRAAVIISPAHLAYLPT